jgi:hypothetical protein
VTTDKLRGLRTLGTDEATEDDHFFLSFALRVNCPAIIR